MFRTSQRSALPSVSASTTRWMAPGALSKRSGLRPSEDGRTLIDTQRPGAMHTLIGFVNPQRPAVVLIDYAEDSAGFSRVEGEC